MSSLAQASNEITCYSSIYAPYSYLKEGRPTGIDIDIVTAIAKKIDLSVSFKIIPWSRLKQNVRAGKIDCAMAFLKSSTYTDNMIFMNSPITTGYFTLFIEENNTEKLQTLTDFYGLTVGVNRGFKAPLVFNQAVANNLIKKYEVGDEQQSLQMLLKSRLSGVLTDKVVGMFNLQQLGITTIVPLKKPITSIAVYLIFSKNMQVSGLVKKFDIALAALRQEGTYQLIIDKYLDN